MHEQLNNPVNGQWSNYTVIYGRCFDHSVFVPSNFSDLTIMKRGFHDHGPTFWSLPKDVLLMLLSYLPTTYVWVLSWSCRGMRTLITTHLHPAKYAPRLEHAAILNDLTLLNLMLKLGNIPDKGMALYAACSKRQEFAAALLEYTGVNTIHGLQGAAAGGHKDLVMKYLMRGDQNPDAKNPMLVMAAKFAGIGGHVPLLSDIFNEMGMERVRYAVDEIFVEVCRSGHERAVSFLLSKMRRDASSRYIGEGLVAAVGANHIDVAHVIRTRGDIHTPYITEAIEEACKRGQWGFVDALIHAKGVARVPETTRYFQSACDGGHQELAERLLKCEDIQFGSGIVPYLHKFPGIVQLALRRICETRTVSQIFDAVLTTGDLSKIRMILEALPDGTDGHLTARYLNSLVPTGYIPGLVTLLCTIENQTVNMHAVPAQMKCHLPFLKEVLNTGSPPGDMLYDACVSESYHVVRYLLGRGMPITARVCSGALFTHNAFMCEHLCRRLDPTYVMPEGELFTNADYGPLLAMMSSPRSDMSPDEQRIAAAIFSDKARK